MVPVLTLVDDEGNSFTFEKDFWLNTYDLSSNKSVQNYTFSAGGKNSADGFPGPRSITIQGMIWADTVAELETKRRNLFLACLKGGKLQKSDDTVSRYMDVKDPDFSYSKGDWRNSEKLTITFLAELPFWVDSIETVHTEIIASGTYREFDVDASGADFIILPSIEIDNDQGNSNPGYVRLKNDTDGGSEMVFYDTDFDADDVLSIDSGTGEVLKNGNEAFDHFVTPWFLRLQPTVNSFVYEGEPCTISVTFRKVYV